jgi:hypothetical protein
MESFLWGYGKLAEEGIVSTKIKEKDKLCATVLQLLQLKMKR